MTLIEGTFTTCETVIISKEEEGSLMICDMESDSDIILKIKDISVDFLKLITKGLEFNEIVKVILTEYDCKKEEVERDLLDFFKCLIDKKIIIKKE